jgi:hypothetical protein
VLAVKILLAVTEASLDVTVEVRLLNRLVVPDVKFVAEAKASTDEDREFTRD